MVLQRIMWRSENGFESNGSWISGDLAKAWLAFLKEKYPIMRHWLEDKSDD